MNMKDTTDKNVIQVDLTELSKDIIALQRKSGITSIIAAFDGQEDAAISFFNINDNDDTLAVLLLTTLDAFKAHTDAMTWEAFRKTLILKLNKQEL